MKCSMFYIVILGALVSYYLSQPIISNQCSSLGSNAPIEERDCQIFLLKKGFCCYLTVTTEVPNATAPDENITVVNHSCIFAPSKDPNERQNIVNSLKYLGSEILIECFGNNYALTLAAILLMILILILN